MLTIGRLADYVGVTPRAIRHYHALGLLPEPERNASGYRSYGAQAVIDLRRIKVLADAGVPLVRVKELIDADPEVLRAAIAEVDTQLRARIRELQRTRRSLQALAEGGAPFHPRPEVAAAHERMRALGVSERTLSMERDAWELIQVLFPQLTQSWIDTQVKMLDDPGFRELYLLSDQAFDWEPDDPRIDQVARRIIAWLTENQPAPDSDGWDDDATAYWLVTNYRRDLSPGWRTLMERVEQLAEEAGYSRQ